MQFQYFGVPYLWEQIYEAAISEANPERRRHLLREAQRAILQRAQALEEQEGTPDFEETMALEAAAEFLRDLHVATQADGDGKEMNPGDHEDCQR